MADLKDAGVSELLAKPNHAVLSTSNPDGSIHSAVVWLNTEDGSIALDLRQVVFLRGAPGEHRIGFTG